MTKVYGILAVLFVAVLLLSLPTSAKKIPSALDDTSDAQISLR